MLGILNYNYGDQDGVTFGLLSLCLEVLQVLRASVGVWSMALVLWQHYLNSTCSTNYRRLTDVQKKQSESKK